MRARPETAGVKPTRRRPNVRNQRCNSYKGSGLNKSSTNGVADQAGRDVDVEFSHEVTAVRLGRLEADVQGGGDLFGRVALGDELEHFPLARREGIGRSV